MENQNHDTSDRELRIARILNAPIDLVWEMWTSPEHIANWWGPNGFTNTIQVMDMKPGGKWDLVMHGPDGKNYQNHSIFTEIIPNKKIAYRHSNPSFLATIIFEDLGEKTQLNWHMLFDTKEEFIAVVKQHGADEGLKQNIEKLVAYLDKQLVK